ncbi:MAG: DinB family protein [Acidimicrobiaceae bacterium]|nr:DinB family protein [Acidimicrobiaceae bacterium]
MIALPIRPPEPVAGPERDQLMGWLDFHRATLLMKCAGLDDDSLRRRALPPSNLTLLGLLQHMALVEIWWFDTILLNADTHLPFASDDDPDSEFNVLDTMSPEEVASVFLANCQRSRELAAPLALETMAARVRPGESVDLRWIYLHMIEEYARHNGHADLLREVLDGTTGL